MSTPAELLHEKVQQIWASVNGMGDLVAASDYDVAIASINRQ